MPGRIANNKDAGARNKNRIKERGGTIIMLKLMRKPLQKEQRGGCRRRRCINNYVDANVVYDF
jgi:hypothetical protein